MIRKRWLLGISGRPLAIQYALIDTSDATLQTWTNTGISEVTVGGDSSAAYSVEFDEAGVSAILWRDTTVGEESNSLEELIPASTVVLTGPSSVTLTFLDSNSDPVPLVDFTIQGQGIARSNSSGVASFGLSDGTYTVIARPTLGVIFTNTTLTVDGSTSLSITGQAAVIVPSGPDNPLLCGVYGYQYVNGEPNEGTRVFAYAYGPPVTIDGLILETTTVHTDTDELGYWNLDLIRGGTYRVTIPNSDINNVVITVPDSNTGDFSTLF